MKKKITYILIFLIIIAIFACGKVNANYIGKTVVKDDNGYHISGYSPAPYQLGDGVKGFYCLNHGETFNEYVIDIEMDLHFNSDGTMNNPTNYGQVTSRMQFENKEDIKALPYLFGMYFGADDSKEEVIKDREVRQYSIWRIKGTDDSSMYDNWKVNGKSAIEYAKSMAYKEYLKGITPVKFYAGSDTKLDREYLGPFYITFAQGSANGQIYKPTFNSIVVNNNITVTKVFTKNGTNYNEQLLSNITSGTAFYIKNSNLKNSSSYNIQLNYQDIFEGDLYICDATSNGEHQAVVAGKFTKPVKTLSTTVQTESLIKLHLHKVDSNGKEIKKEFKFKVSATQYFVDSNGDKVGNAKTILNNEEIAIKEGEFDLEMKPAMAPDNNGDYAKTMVYVTITEANAPAEYALLSKPLNIIYVKGKNATTWNSTYCPYYQTVAQILGLTEIKGENGEKLAEENGKGYKNLDKLLKDNLLFYMCYYSKPGDQTVEQYFDNWIANKKANTSTITDYAELTNEKFVDILTEKPGLVYEMSVKGIVTLVTGGITGNDPLAPLDQEVVDEINEYFNKKSFTDQFGFETFGYWKYDREDRNAAWPHYYYSIDNDKIKVNPVSNDKRDVNVGREDHIYIYNNLNRAAIQSLKLFKIDALNDNKLLDGSKFTAKFSNVESYKFNNIEIPLEEGQTQTFEVKDGQIEITDVVFRNSEEKIKITIEEIEVPQIENGKYKKLDGTIEIELEYSPEGLKGTATYNGSENVRMVLNKDVVVSDNKISYNQETPVSTESIFTVDIIVPNIRVIDISGIVWLEKDTYINNKVNGDVNGIKDEGEMGLENVIVYLYKKTDTSKPFSGPVLTDKDGKYSFNDIPYDKDGYYVVFEYDGVHYISTKPVESKAVENTETRTVFNAKFNTIELGKAINKNNTSTINLFYDKVEEDNMLVSKLNTLMDGNGQKSRTINGKEVVQEHFAMKAITDIITETTEDINYGLVARGTDLAIGNNEYVTETSINGKSVEQKHDIANNILQIGQKRPEEFPTYVEGIAFSDYTYRIRQYFNNRDQFKAVDFTENTDPDTTLTSGNQLKITVTYRVDVVNQRGANTLVNELTYQYDNKLKFNPEKTQEVNNKEVSENNYKFNVVGDSTIKINTNKLLVEPSQRKQVYLVFDLFDEKNKNNIVEDYKYKNVVEITSYTTDDGLIDVDSEPGDLNYNSETKQGRFEDDSAQKVLEIKILRDTPRKISGYVWEDQKDNDGNYNGLFDSTEPKVNGVCVQLIELKNVFNGVTYERNYEYIWQETVSGTNEGLRVKLDGKGLENYSYEEEAKDGYYEFKDFIPGNYIVRFIYGDGSVVNTDVYGNVLKYNGQDYKSTKDTNYQKPDYDEANYAANASVARDNEARRLETMSYSVLVDQQKGLLLKLLDVKTVGDEVKGIDASDLNATEVKTLAGISYDYLQNEFGLVINDAQDINNLNVFEVDPLDLKNDDITKLNTKINTLRERVVLPYTWMCAETSKISVPVEVISLNSVGFGLAKRPEQTMELKKYITGFTLIANNGQPIVDANIAISEYFDNHVNGESVSGQIDEIRKGLSIIRDGDSTEGKIQYEAGSPTELNTIIEGAKLQFKYTVYANNISEDNYLPHELNTTAYSQNDYSSRLKTKASEAKADLAKVAPDYETGHYLGTYYYTGKHTNEEDTKMAVTSINDYINKDLSLVAATDNVSQKQKVQVDQYILDAIYNLQKIEEEIDLVEYNSKDANNQLTNKQEYKELYTVQLSSKFAISASGTKEFDNYIAEVMEYSNAAGRRATITPGNAEIIDHEYRPGRSHEPDEVDSLRVQLGVAAGDDKQTSYTLAIIITAGVAIVAIGAFTVKKYIIKK